MKREEPIYVNGKCWECDIPIHPTDEDAGTYREHFCSQECERRMEQGIGLKEGKTKARKS